MHFQEEIHQNYQQHFSINFDFLQKHWKNTLQKTNIAPEENDPLGQTAYFPG